MSFLPPIDADAGRKRKIPGGCPRVDDILTILYLEGLKLSVIIGEAIRGKPDLDPLFLPRSKTDLPEGTELPDRPHYMAARQADVDLYDLLSFLLSCIPYGKTCGNIIAVLPHIK